MSWDRYLASVSVELPGIPVDLFTEQEDGRELICVELTVRCHVSGETIKVKTRRPVQPVYLLTDDEAAAVVRDLVRIAMLHEIDEAISVYGKRVFNPHERLT